MANGILIVDKPAGWTSQDVAAKLRGVFHEKRVGHGGTLDPMATGVLPIFIGRATRAVPFFEHADKVYEAGLRLGLVTDTQDVTGRTLETHEVDVTQAQLEAALDSFRGEIAQIPPMYSAIKVNGQKLYALARQGKAVERAPRPVTIFALDLLGGAGADWRLRVHCSKGTYVRTLCHDIGAALGCGGCLSALRRTRAGAYDVTRSHTMAEILAADDPEALLLPTDSLFSDRPALKVAENAERKLRNGAPLHTPKLKDGEYRVYNQAGDFLLLAQVANGELKTVKS
ncbi:MAG: tRNA pseudouridine(55) synthase TruB, partial [Oscillospiraceae bacterium]|nr:tRNA pseudouridine(55) synthase TruB [Oscillospiraceae bacterium]